MGNWKLIIKNLVPLWTDFEGDSTDEIEELGREVAKRLEGYAKHPHIAQDEYRASGFGDIIDEFRELYGDAHDMEGNFNYTLGSLYDWADGNSVWLQP